MLNTILLQADAPAMGGANGYSSIIMMLAIFAIFYFLLIRPQSKQRKEIQKFRDSLLVGDSILTAGGIYGKVKEIKDNIVVVEIDKGVNIRVDKNQVYKDTVTAQSASANAK